MSGSWAHEADRVLAKLFVLGRPAPTREQLREAYPFGERAMWPYKVWCARVKAWKATHAKGIASPASGRDYAARHVRCRDYEDDGATGELFQEAQP